MSRPDPDSKKNNQLSQYVESLALLLVTAELSGNEGQNAIEQLRGAVEMVYESARSADFEEAVALANRLKTSLDQAQNRTSACSLLETELQTDITKLQEVLAAAGSVSLSLEQTKSAAAGNLGILTCSGLISSALSQDPELVFDFLAESGEHLSTIETQLLIIEQNPANAAALNSVFRAFHTIKGLAGFLDFAAVQESAHEIETLLDKARNHELLITSPVVDVILEGADHLKTWMQYIASVLAGKPQAKPSNGDALHQRIRRHGIGMQSPQGSEMASSDLATLSEAITPAFSLSKLPERQSPPTLTESATRLAGEKSGLEQKLPQPNLEMQRNEHRPGEESSAEARSVKVDTAKLDYLVDMVGEMVIAQSLICHDPDLTEVKSPSLLRNVSQATRIIAELQKTAMAMRLLPVGQAFARLHRLVRDLSRKSGKMAELEISGEDTELDRTIVEQLADPLMHMVRNSLDHGIEKPEERLSAGKPAKAKVVLRACHQGGNILIEVGDDGRGLNREKIVRKAKEKRLIEQADHMADNDVFALIFEPGFSTADQVTDISGRGVGMDVVKRQIQKLRGRIDIQSLPGQGTTFFLKLPLTLALIDGLVIGIGEERYIVPVFAVHESLRPTNEMISTLPNGSELALIRGSLLPVVRLNRLFGIQARSENLTECLFVICEGRGKRFCLVVDELIGKQEVVIKTLGKIFQNVTSIAGGAILGDGRIGLILDVEAIQGGAVTGVA